MLRRVQTHITAESTEQARSAVERFRNVLAREPGHVLAGLNLAEALLCAGQMNRATEQAGRTLAVLEQEGGEEARVEPRPAWLDEPHFPPGPDLFALEWDRAAVEHAGAVDQEIRAKRNLIRWRLHALLASLTGDLVHYHQAALARPDFSLTQAALGCALARARRFTEAAPHLRRAVETDPYDLAAARALFEVLGEVGDDSGRQRLMCQRRLLHQTHPEAVAAEAWFSEVPAAAEAPAAARPRVSLCMIVKNEENNLPACLESVAGVVDEIVLVDTGSTDGTRAVAAGFGVRVVDFPWVDSFAAARNEALRHATGDWIFWLDADDRIDVENRKKLRSLFAALKDDNVAYVMKCVCLPDDQGHTATVVDHVRLFKRHPEIRWKYRVHEQILPAIRRLGGSVRWTDVVIHHVGYQDVTVRGRKLERDLRLLHLENAENPDDPFTLFNLGWVYQELRQPGEALPALRRSLELSHPTDSIVRKLYALIAQAHRRLGQTTDALAACRAGLGHYPEDAELLFLEGHLLRQRGDRAGAEHAWQRLLSTQEPAHFASVDADLRGHKTRQNLAALFEEQGRHPEAEAQWRTVIAEQPDFLPAWLSLADIYLRQERWQPLEEVIDRLESRPAWRLEAMLLRARRHLVAGEFTLARQLLATALAQAPEAIRPRVLLSHALLQEGRDWAAAEQALRDVLALDPANAEAQHNLGVVLREQGRLPL